jgi:hypothetical protein
LRLASEFLHGIPVFDLKGLQCDLCLFARFFGLFELFLELDSFLPHTGQLFVGSLKCITGDCESGLPR